jgi:hypothetical protein
MPIIRRLAIWIFVLLAGISATRIEAQTVDSNVPFLIDPNKPYVYLKFDHIGAGIQREQLEPKRRVWLRIVNNCRLPVVVAENGTPDGSLEDERQVMYEVVPTILPEFGLAVGDSIAPDGKPKQEQPGEPNLTEVETIPRGYMEEVGSTESVPPGKGILFSVPVNHLGKRWHIEIPFTFGLPRGRCCREANIGGETKMVIEYGLWDLPPAPRKEIQQK